MSDAGYKTLDGGPANGSLAARLEAVGCALSIDSATGRVKVSGWDRLPPDLQEIARQNKATLREEIKRRITSVSLLEQLGVRAIYVTDPTDAAAHIAKAVATGDFSTIEEALWSCDIPYIEALVRDFVDPALWHH